MICQKKKRKQIRTGSPVIVPLKNLYTANSGNAAMIQFEVSASLFEVYNVLDVTNTRFKERKLQLGTPDSTSDRFCILWISVLSIRIYTYDLYNINICINLISVLYTRNFMSNLESLALQITEILKIKQIDGLGLIESTSDPAQEEIYFMPVI